MSASLGFSLVFKDDAECSCLFHRARNMGSDCRVAETFIDIDQKCSLGEQVSDSSDEFREVRPCQEAVIGQPVVAGAEAIATYKESWELPRGNAGTVQVVDSDKWSALAVRKSLFKR